MKTKALDAEISRKLTNQFGKQFARYIDDSPTLRRDLRRLRELEVRIKRWNGKDGAYCRSDPADRKHSFIAIGSNASPIMKAIFLAHEAYHCLHGSTPIEPDTRKISRERYISMGIAEETRAFMHQTRVANELWESCNHVIPAWQMHLMLVSFTGGYASMKDHVLTFKESVSEGSYEKAYGRIWDQAKRQAEKKEKARKAKAVRKTPKFPTSGRNRQAKAA